MLYLDRRRLYLHIDYNCTCKQYNVKISVEEVDINVSV